MAATHAGRQERGFEIFGRHEQGEEAEFKVALALDALKARGLIVGYIHAEKHGELDRNGIDFLVALFGGLSLLLQIKSSPNTVKRHIKRHPHIPCIVVEPHHRSIGSVRKRIMSIIRKKSRIAFIANRDKRGID